MTKRRARGRRFWLRPKWIIVVVSAVLVAGIAMNSCTTTPPERMDNSCSIFMEKRKWYHHAKQAEHRWGVSIGMQLAFMHQESRFHHDAQTPRKKILWIIPWGRQSSAFGYAQAVDGTWDAYKQATGNDGADRDDFVDAADFIGWYVHESYRSLGLPKSDVYSHYLAYHEGQGGYKRKSYEKKPWLKKVAAKVKRRAELYNRQLSVCENRLQRRPWWWPI